MAQNQFKLRYLPNLDGSESSTALTNNNTAFYHTYLGDDSTGDGTREKPYRSAGKALLKGKTYTVFRGLTNEAISNLTTILIGDDINQTLITSNYSVIVRCYNLTVDNLPNTSNYSEINRIISLGDSNRGQAGYVSNSSGGCTFLSSFNLANPQVNYWGVSMIKCTVVKQVNTSYSSAMTTQPWRLQDWILGGINFGTSYTAITFRYCVFPSDSIFSYLGVPIVHPALTDNSTENINLLRNAFIAAGMPSTAFDFYFPIDSFGNIIFKYINETVNGGGVSNIYNSYNAKLTGTLSAAISANSAKTSITLTVADSSIWPASGRVFMPTSADYTANGVTMPAGSYEVYNYSSVTINSSTSITLNGSYTFKAAHASSSICTKRATVIDTSLNPSPTNEALWASATGGYVGGMRAAYDSIQSNMTSIVVVDEATGADTATAGDLIYLNSAAEFVFNNLSTQTWNRFRDKTTIKIELGSTFKGGGGRSTDGSPFGYYIGKKQNLIGTTKYYAGDTLTVGKWYKVFNDTAISVSNAIIYNSVQYLPEYTFCCVAGATTFSLLNAGTGTYVMEIIADVLESIEIIPYDDMTTESAFPKFSCPIVGDCKLLYYTAAGATRYGKTAGNPVLFADLALANLLADFGSISNKISYYDSWAISNADQEFFVLADPSLTSPKSTYFTTAIPTIRYYRRSINAHFDKPYDY